MAGREELPGGARGGRSAGEPHRFRNDRLAGQVDTDRSVDEPHRDDQPGLPLRLHDDPRDPIKRALGDADRVAGLHLRDGDQRKAGELELADLEQVGVQGGLVGHVENSNAEVRLQYFEPGVVKPPEE